MCWPELIACIVRRAVKDATHDECGRLQKELEEAKSGRDDMAAMLAHCDCTDGPCPFGIQAADNEDSPCTAKQLAEKLKSVMQERDQLRSHLAAAGQVIVVAGNNSMLPLGAYAEYDQRGKFHGMRWADDLIEGVVTRNGFSYLRLPDTLPPSPAKVEEEKRPYSGGPPVDPPKNRPNYA